MAAWLFAGLLLAPLQPAWAALDSQLQPLAADSPLAGRLGAVGKVLTGHGDTLAMATGFLVSPCHVLTAAHVLARVGEPMRLGSSVRFLPERGPATALPQNTHWGKVVAASPQFRMSTTPERFDLPTIAEDWALVELDQTMPDITPLKLLFAGAKIARQAQFSLVGYPADGRGQQLHAHEHCLNWAGLPAATDLAGVVIADCAVRPGMSGGPMLLEGGAEPIAAGIVVQRFETGRKVMAVGVSIAAFAAQLEEAMRASEVCAVGAPFVWPPASQDER